METWSIIAILAAIVSASAAVYNVYFTITRSLPSIRTHFKLPPRIQLKPDFNRTSKGEAYLFNDGSTSFSILHGRLIIQSRKINTTITTSTFAPLKDLPIKLEPGGHYKHEFSVHTFPEILAGEKIDSPFPLEIVYNLIFELQVGKAKRRISQPEFHIKVYESQEQLNEEGTIEEFYDSINIPESLVQFFKKSAD